MDELSVVAAFKIKLEPNEDIDDALDRFERILYDSGIPPEEIRDVRIGGCKK